MQYPPYALFNQRTGFDVAMAYFDPKAYYHYVFREGSTVNRYRK